MSMTNDVCNTCRSCHVDVALTLVTPDLRCIHHNISMEKVIVQEKRSFDWPPGDINIYIKLLSLQIG